MTLNLANIPLKAAANYPDSPAILLADQVVTYSQLSQQIRACSVALLQQDLHPGDNIALMLPNVPQFTTAYFGVIAMGAAIVPLNVLLVEQEIEYHLRDSDAKALIVWDAFLPHALPAAKKLGCKLIVCRSPDNQDSLPEGVMDLRNSIENIIQAEASQNFELYASNPNDTAVILYTSGTTGQPKGAELSQFNMYDNARFIAERMLRTSNDALELLAPGQVALAALPLFHSFGQTVIQNGFLMNGAAISLLPRFTPVSAAALISKHKVTFFAGVPTMYIGLLNDPDVDTKLFSTLKYAVSGGAALPVKVLQAFKERFNVDILEGYGLSETSPVACFNSFMQTPKPGTVGPAIDVCQIKVTDEQGNNLHNGKRGEILIRGSNVMKGYYKRSDATKDVLINGWFHTGDIGIIDDDGFLSIVDRKKDMIIRGGYNIYPREIEEVLYTHPNILETAVIGIPDDIQGEEVLAVIAIKKNTQLPHDELEAFCRKHLAAYKVPRKTMIMDSLPKGPTGKIMKRSIKVDVV